MDSDVIIIGGGPAGLTAAVYAARAGKSVIIFEGNKLGGTLAKLKKIVNFPGSISDDGKQIAERMARQALSFGAKVEYEFVRSVHKKIDGFTVYTDTREFSCKYVIYCGGMERSKPKTERKFTGSGVSYCAVCDGNFFKGKTVAVIGDGESAVRDVEYLLPLCKKVYHVYTEKAADGAEPLKGKVDEFLGDAVLTGISVGGMTVAVDGAFIAMGGVATGLVSGLETKDGLIVNSEGRTNIPNFFVAGDAGAGSIRQVVSACFDGARAAYYCK